MKCIFSLFNVYLIKNIFIETKKKSFIVVTSLKLEWENFYRVLQILLEITKSIKYNYSKIQFHILTLVCITSCNDGLNFFLKVKK